MKWDDEDGYNKNLVNSMFNKNAMEWGYYRILYSMKVKHWFSLISLCIDYNQYLKVENWISKYHIHTLRRNLCADTLAKYAHGLKFCFLFVIHIS